MLEIIGMHKPKEIIGQLIMILLRVHICQRAIKTCLRERVMFRYTL